MKRLWMTYASLSIFLISGLLAQEPVTEERGGGTCWVARKDTNGLEVFDFIPSSNRCGWFSVEQRSHDTAGSNIGWNGYIKIVNARKPEKAFYLGSTIPNRQLKFGKDSTVACYICQPWDNTNCYPNDPSRAADCFKGTYKINCDTQVDCSKVIKINECYSEAKGPIAQASPNDLGLCQEADLPLLNYSGGGSANNYLTQGGVFSQGDAFMTKLNG